MQVDGFTRQTGIVVEVAPSRRLAELGFRIGVDPQPVLVIVPDVGEPVSQRSRGELWPPRGADECERAARGGVGGGRGDDRLQRVWCEQRLGVTSNRVPIMRPRRRAPARRPARGPSAMPPAASTGVPAIDVDHAGTNGSVARPPPWPPASAPCATTSPRRASSARRRAPPQRRHLNHERDARGADLLGERDEIAERHHDRRGRTARSPASMRARVDRPRHESDARTACGCAARPYRISRLEPFQIHRGRHRACPRPPPSDTAAIRRRRRHRPSGEHDRDGRCRASSVSAGRQRPCHPTV